ncbi:MAG: hypothetical protein IPG99_18865 [Ignavibacteria bacterium]|nr:hypothetical protein [Ignavibacteria bacterium]
MNNLKVLILLLMSTVIIVGCNKDTVKQTSTDKLNEKKEAITKTQPTDTKAASNNINNDTKLYKVEKVEKAAGRRVHQTWYGLKTASRFQ